jgi:hypothetical protein
MNIELQKNAEGYTDPTAAATLTQPEPGDIWAYNNEMALVVKNHGPFCSILLLMDKCGGPDDVKIMTSKGPWYTDPRRLTYGLRRKMFRHLETVSVEDFDYTVEAVAMALAIELPREEKATAAEKTDTQEAEKLREEVAQLQADLSAMRDLAVLKGGMAEAARAGETKAKNQLELLRDMYNELLAKVVGGMVNDD